MDHEVCGEVAVRGWSAAEGWSLHGVLAPAGGLVLEGCLGPLLEGSGGSWMLRESMVGCASMVMF